MVNALGVWGRSPVNGFLETTSIRLRIYHEGGRGGEGDSLVNGFHATKIE